MKQRWLIKPLPVDESRPTLELDAVARHELVTLMAMAIEHVCLQHTQLHQQVNGALTDEHTTPSQDHSGTSPS